MTAKQKILLLIVIATLWRCLLAATIHLGNDEVYYLSYARHLQWNYFDHPPMVALLIRLTTLNLHWVTDFSVRLGPILLAAVNTWLIYRIATLLKNENAGFIAALLFTASFYSSIIAGTFIMPDAPQHFFWIIALYLLVQLFTQPTSPRKINRLLLGFGFVTGFCIMSKVHGVFLWLGAGLYILCYRRNLLRNPYLYLSVLITAVCVSPILFWNVENHFITYTFHSSRVVPGNHIDVNGFVRELFGGMFYNNPINYLLYVVVLWQIIKWRNSKATSAEKLLLLLSLPLTVILLGVSLLRDTLPHWSGPGYTALLLITAIRMEGYVSRVYFRLVKYAVGFTGIIAVAGVLVINFYPGTLGKKQPDILGKGDVTLDMYGWNTLKTHFGDLVALNAQRNITSTRFIIANKWFPGAHVDNYVAQPLHMNFLALGKLEDIHTYAWLNQYRPALKKGDDAYFITTSNNFKDPKEVYSDCFDTILKPEVIMLQRCGKPAKKAFVYVLKGYRGVCNQP